jgi:hypothetical protein
MTTMAYVVARRSGTWDVLAALQDERGGTSDSARSAAGWIAATSRQRGEALRDLLLLADRLPRGRAAERPRFPRIESKPA